MEPCKHVGVGVVVGVGVGGIGGVVGALTGVLDDEVLVAPHVVDALRRRPELVRPQPAPTHTTLSHNRRPPRRASARGRCRRPNSAAMHAPSASRRRRKRAERKEQSRAMEGDRRQGSAASGGACDRPRRELPPLTVPPRRFAKGGCGQSGRKEARDDVGRRRGAPGHGVDGAVAGVGVAPRRRRHLLHRVRRVLEQIVRLVRLPA